MSQRLGHASIVTLGGYSHELPVMKHEAAAAFDELFTNDHGPPAVAGEAVNSDSGGAL